jgi:hypothetical protein
MEREVKTAALVMAGAVIAVSSLYLVLDHRKAVAESDPGYKDRTPPIVNKTILPAHKIPDLKPGDYVKFTMPVTWLTYWHTGTVLKTSRENGRLAVLVDDGLWKHWVYFPAENITKIDTLPPRDLLNPTEFDEWMLSVNTK